MRPSEPVQRGGRDPAAGVDALLGHDPGARRRLGPLLALLGAISVAIAGVFVGGDLGLRVVAYDVDRTASRSPVPTTWREAARDLSVNAAMHPTLRDVRELLNVGLPVFDLRIPAGELRDLHAIADKVVMRGLSTGIDRPAHKGTLCVDGIDVPIELKLRGLMAYHFNKNHFSFRLKLPSNLLVDGMEEINLLEPYDKGIFIDPVTHRFLAKRGLLTLRDGWAVVQLNGQVMGLYQLFEHFGRSVADRSHRPEGTIFGGDGQIFGREGGAMDKTKVALEEVLACLPGEGAAPTAACGWPLHERLFDHDRMAWSHAMTSLLHSSHAYNPVNLRLFWDPAWGRFEPVPWDYNMTELDPRASPTGETAARAWSDLLLAPGPARRLRDQRLWLLLGEDVEAMVAASEEIFAAIAPAMRLDRRHWGFDADQARLGEYARILRGNAAALKDILRHADLRVRWRSVAPGLVRLQMHNHARSSVQVDALVLDDGSAVALPAAPTAIVDGVWKGVPGQHVVDVAVPAGRQPRSLRARNLITAEALAQVALGQAAAEGDLPAPLPAEATPALTGLPPGGIVGVRVVGRAVHFGPGEVAVTGTLSVPDGLATVIEAGTTLLLGPGAGLILHGDVRAEGRAEAPIIIRSADPARPFGTFALLGRRWLLPKARFAHVRVEGGVGASGPRTHFTSAFALHGVDLYLRDCAFVEGRADDGINFKNTLLDVQRLRIVGSRDDAFDCDFCRGKVRDSVVERSGGDGFDFSGSDVELRDNRVEGCADKGFSIGEDSRGTIHGALVRRCITGLAAKDLSVVHVASGTFEDIQVGFAQYVKKPSFGPSSLQVDPGVTLVRAGTPRLTEVFGGPGRPGICPRSAR